MDETECLPTLIDHTSMCYIRFSKVACGDTFSMASSTKGQLYTWGTFMVRERILDCCYVFFFLNYMCKRVYVVVQE